MGEEMRAIKVWKDEDEKGRQVLFAELENHTVGVIKYDDNYRKVNDEIVSDNEIHDAYEAYGRT